MQLTIPYTPNPKQAKFHSSPCEETFYGGAKGGGKSCALTIEGFMYGIDYPGATIYFFRETYDDLEQNLIQEWITKIPRELYKGNPKTQHEVTLVNGSRVLFRYIANDTDAESYQGRSMDWIGVDELTKHSEYAITILLSCLRSPKGFPPRFRATGNPGGKGHAWVKKRYIDSTGKGSKVVRDKKTNNRIQFIPAKVYDNEVLMKNDPNYAKRLEGLPTEQRKAFLEGDWDIFEGQYFTVWDYEKHVIKPFPVPTYWKHFLSIDYGMDMMALYEHVTDSSGRVYTIKELCLPNLSIPEAAIEITRFITPGIKYEFLVASPDLFNRRQETKVTGQQLLYRNGIDKLKFPIIKADDSRVSGWQNMYDYLFLRKDENGEMSPRWQIFSTCQELIKCIPNLIRDKKNPDDVSDSPHDITHSPESCRYFLKTRPLLSPKPSKKQSNNPKQNNQRGTICSKTGY